MQLDSHPAPGAPFQVPRHTLSRDYQEPIRCVRQLFSKVNTVRTDGLKTMHHFLLSGVVTAHRMHPKRVLQKSEAVLRRVRIQG